jgi:hypothetical protein
MTMPRALTALFVVLILATTAAADVRFLPETSRQQLDDAPPSLGLLTWQLPEGLLVVDRRGPDAPDLGGDALTGRHPDSEWYLVSRPHRARGAGQAASADPATFGHVHLTSSAAWVVEVPRARLDDFLSAAFELHYLDLAPITRTQPAADHTVAPTRADPVARSAYVDALDQQAFNQLIREISGDTSFWYDGAERTVTTRYYNTASNALVADYLAEKLAGYGYTVELQAFTVNGHACRNVVATLTGTTSPEQIVVVGGHYDSTSFQAGTLAPGAEDNASGTSLVMEIARASAGRPFERTVQFVLFDAEEVGLRGSQHFVAEAVGAGRDIVAAITADMVAYHDRNYGVIIEGQDEWEWLMQAMADNVAANTDIAYRKDYDSWGSDHVPFQQAGIAAFLAIDWDWSEYPYYHRTTDTWARIEATAPLGLQIARAAAGTLADVAGLQDGATSAPLPSVPLVRLAAHPNPFNPQTTLRFSLDVPTRGELTIHDLSGRRLATPARGDFLAGEHAVDWNGADHAGRALASGVYVARLHTTAGTASLKLNLVR